MTEKEKIIAEIKMLEVKLVSLEEAEKQPTLVSSFRYNQRTYIRHEDMGLFAWLVVDKADPIEDVDTLKILENEVIKQKEEYPYKKYTPEETEKSLKDAMKQATKDGVFDEPKPETLYGVCMNWLDEFHTNEVQVTVSDLVDRIKDWLPATINDYGLSEWDEAWNSGFNDYHNCLMEKLGND
jgi:hypothetical protein